jgi:hypothetical protein
MLSFGISDSFSHKGQVSAEKGQLQLHNRIWRGATLPQRNWLELCQATTRSPFSRVIDGPKNRRLVTRARSCSCGSSGEKKSCRQRKLPKESGLCPSWECCP